MSDLPQWLRDIVSIFLWLLPWLLWAGFWLFAVDWRKLWPVLAEGAWAPLVLLGVLAALVWSQIAPSDYTRLGFVVIPNFWWQFVVVAGIIALMLFAGWLQEYFNYEPPEYAVEPPPPVEHGHH